MFEKRFVVALIAFGLLMLILIAAEQGWFRLLIKDPGSLFLFLAFTVIIGMLVVSVWRLGFERGWWG